MHSGIFPLSLIIHGLQCTLWYNTIFPFPYGAHNVGILGPYKPNVLHACAAAMCTGPVSLLIKTGIPVIRNSVSFRLVFPARFITRLSFFIDVIFLITSSTCAALLGLKKRIIFA